MSSSPVTVTSISDIAPVLSNEFLEIQATTGCRFTLKRICDMIEHTVIRTLQISAQNTTQSIMKELFIKPVWLNVA